LGTAEGDARTVLGVEPVTNQAGDDRDRYLMASRDYLRVDRTARKRGWDILGCYHSHPDAPPEPSAIDLACAWPWYVYLIVSVDGGRVGDRAGWTLCESQPDGRRTFRRVDVVGDI